jgi:pSer/pThr/pTyr-binding forkhead associated (FHA) protein
VTLLVLLSSLTARFPGIHARFTPSEDGVLLEDLASKNGTFCNGERLEEPVLLSDGDLVQVSLVQHFVFLKFRCHHAA